MPKPIPSPRPFVVALLPMTLALLAGGCGAKVTGQECVPGRVATCQCHDGTSAWQLCDETGGYEPCDCASPITPYGPPASPEPGPPTGEYLLWGPERLIDAFVGESGIYVVVEQEARLFDRAGNLLAHANLGRDITTSAFDGSRLVVFDKALVTVFDAGLQTLASRPLIEPCDAAVFVGGGRVVCRAQLFSDSEEMFVYDGLTGERLTAQESHPAFPEGPIRRRVPGTNDFVLLEIGPYVGAAGIALLQVDEAHGVGEAGYVALHPTPAVVAFDGDPAEHVILGDGSLLFIYGPGCSAKKEDGYCFQPAGSLGTLSEGEGFVAMDDEAGKIYGLVDPSLGSSTKRVCESGCYLEQVDIATRSVEKSSFHDLSAGAVVASWYDAASRSLVVAYENERTTGSYPGHGVSMLPVE